LFAKVGSFGYLGVTRYGITLATQRLIHADVVQNCRKDIHNYEITYKLETMNAWSNIQFSPQDPEIAKIDDLEKRLGELSNQANKIRELITRFEVCHFKYRQQLRIIRDSIISLNSNVDINKIGIHHVQHGENSWKSDTTGKSLIGQQYIWAIKEWLNDDHPKGIFEHYNKKSDKKFENGWVIKDQIK
jgi:hypothetical protein